MWKRVVALNLAFVLLLALFPIQEIMAFAESRENGYAVFYKNDGSNETFNSHYANFSSNGAIKLYSAIPEFELENKRITSYNSKPDGSGVSYKLTSCIYESYTNDEANPANLYAVWEDAPDNSILYISQTGTTDSGKDYYIQSGLSQSVTLADDTVFNEPVGTRVVGWKSLSSNNTYFPGEMIDVTSNMTLESIPGINYFNIYYRSDSDTGYYKNKIVVEDLEDYSWYSKRIDDNADGIVGKIFIGWNSMEDGSGEWIAELGDDTPHNLYAQYEPYPDGDSWVRIYSESGLENKRKYGVIYADDSNSIVLPEVISDNKEVAYWYSGYRTYPAGEKVELQKATEKLIAATINENSKFGLIYGDGGKTKPYPSEYIGINYYLTSAGSMSIYSFDELDMFHKENNVFVGYRGNKTGKVYDYYSDVETALSNEKDGKIAEFTAQYEPVENGYIQYWGNGGLTSNGKGQYYEKIDFSDITTEMYAENRFVHPDGDNFLGWSDSADDPTRIYISNTEVVHSKNTILYAQWGDNAVIAHGTTKYGEEYTKIYKNVNKISSLTYDGKNNAYFKGWNTKADGSGDWYTCDDTVPFGKVLELYEQWEQAPSEAYYYVISNVKQADGTQLKIISMNYEKELIRIPDNTNIRYWCDSKRYNRIPYNSFADETKYVYSPGDELEISSGTVIMPFNPPLTITYNENIGQESSTRVQYHMSSYGSLRVYSPYDVFPDISDSRVFINWNTSPDGTGESYPVNEYIGNSKTLYAQWFSETSAVNGTCGEGVNWRLTGDGTLTISGNGKMDDNYSWDEERYWNSLKPYIKNIIVEEGISNIGYCAFYECTNLESVTIPKSVTEICNDAFYGCNNIKRVNISDISAWCSINFNWDPDANPLSMCDEVYLNGVLTTDITIPSTVTSINNYAFYNCKWLEGISFEGDLPQNIWYVFDGCNNLKSFGVKTLEAWINGARYFEYNLTNNAWDLYVDGKLLEDLIIPKNITWFNSNKAFYNCKSIRSVSFHDNFYQIPESAFANCINLSQINLTASINSIGKNAFYNTAFYNNEANWDNGVLCLGSWLVKVKENISGEFRIPAKLTKIAYNVFEGTGIAKVYIHSNVNSMQGAFADATSITTVELAPGTTTISSRAFYNCTNLSELIIPESVCQVEQDAFTNTAFYNDESNWEGGLLYVDKMLVDCKVIGSGVCVVKDGTKLLASSIFMNSGYGCFILPDSVKYIGSQAFYNCSLLTEITLPKELEQLQWGLFYGCSSLKSITLPDGITQMSSQVFSGCKSLETIYNMPLQLDWVGTPLFENCNALKDIYYEGTSSQWQKQYGGYNLGVDMSCVTVHCEGDNRPADSCGKELTWNLDNNGVLTISGTGKMYDFEENNTPWIDVNEEIREVVISEGVTKIGSYSFSDCPNLVTVKIPSTITSSGIYAFENSKNSNNIKNVYIEDLSKWCAVDFLNSRGNPLFGGTNLYLNNNLVTELTVPNEVTYIGDFAFLGCSSIETVNIPKNVGNAYCYWFAACNNLKQINVATENKVYCSRDGNLFSKDMTVMYQYARGKDAIHYIVPESVVKINNEAFSGCSKLQSVVFPDGFSEIGYWAFSSCTALKEISLPNTVTRIYQGAFSGCSQLEYINYPGSAEDWNAVTIESENDLLIKAMSNSAKARTKTLVSADGKTFVVTPVNINNGNFVILALYDGNRFVEVQKAAVEGDDITFVTTKAYTNAKVMVWSKLAELKPICDAEIVK